MTDEDLARAVLPDDLDIARRALKRMDPRYRKSIYLMVQRQHRRYYESGKKPRPPPTTGPIKGEVHLTIIREEFLCQKTRPMLDTGPKTEAL